MDRLNRNLLQRLRSAWEAFRDEPAPRFFVVENVGPLGWCILERFATYDAAFDYRAGLPQAQTRVMTEDAWQRMTLERMGSREPWIALGRINAQMARARSDVADYQAILRANSLDSFMRQHHP